MKQVLVVGTADTKGAELAFLADAVACAGAPVLTVDVGTRAASIEVDIAAETVAACHPEGADAVLGGNDRGVAVAAMGSAFASFISGRDDIAGVIGIGGGGGTSIITAGMRQLPYGLPKVMVSTLASGDVGPFVDVSDIVMIPSVTDLAGLNRLSRTILHNAAHAIAGMALAPPVDVGDRKAVGLTMFGVTTACVTAIADRLGDDRDGMIFHATGTGGRSMEKLVDEGVIDGVIDITTTEVADMIVGGVLAATADRFGAIIRKGIPAVISVGALDMVNFWVPSSVPERFADRLFYHHNPNVTLMRTTAAESREIGVWIASRLNDAQGPLRILIPEKGVSALDIDGGPFFDPEADAALFDAIDETLEPAPDRRVERLPLHINDPDFAIVATDTFKSIL